MAQEAGRRSRFSHVDEPGHAGLCRISPRGGQTLRVQTNPKVAGQRRLNTQINAHKR
jgi:hypothetical protein